MRIGSNKEILSAPDVVFQPEHRVEARTLIYESEILLDYLDPVSEILTGGKLRFATVTEPGRQTSFRYEDGGDRNIRLTREHEGIGQILKKSS